MVGCGLCSSLHILAVVSLSDLCFAVCSSSFILFFDFVNNVFLFTISDLFHKVQIVYYFVFSCSCIRAVAKKKKGHLVNCHEAFAVCFPSRISLTYILLCVWGGLCGICYVHIVCTHVCGYMSSHTHMQRTQEDIRILSCCSPSS